jgi:hypothetical protein
LVLAEGIQGNRQNKLVEGEQPKAYFIEQTGLDSGGPHARGTEEDDR